MKKTETSRPAAATTRRRPASKSGDGRSASASVVDPNEVRVADVMQRDVTVLSRNDTIRQAAERLEDVHISGAPVVDDAGRLVGVLSLSDIARSEHVRDTGLSARFEGRDATGSESYDREEPLDEELFPTEDYYEQVQGDLLVDDWMTPGVIQVAPDMTLAQVCRVLLDEDIHRVFVVARDKLVGVLSTEDVVRLLAAPAPTKQRPELR